MYFQKRMYRAVLGVGSAFAVAVAATGPGLRAEERDGIYEEIVVVGNTPVKGVGLTVERLPFMVQRVAAEELARFQNLDLTDYGNSHLGSVSINSAQNNPLQPDLQFRGFTASPLLGLPQGVTLYQNGARINEPLGDSVNWDLLPSSAIDSLTLISGANPVFGLNTLGGALAVTMKEGFSFNGNQIEVSGGSWQRYRSVLQSGGNNGRWGYYLNLDYFDEVGWRDLSESDALNAYASLSWRDGERSAANLAYQRGSSNLIGNGSLPVGLVAVDREAVFTAPDVTDNRMQMLSFDGMHYFQDDIQLAGTAFFRVNTTDTFNGDGSEFELCDFGGAEPALLEDGEEAEEKLMAGLGLDLEALCEGDNPAVGNFEELARYIENQAQSAGFDPEAFELEDVSGELSGTGILSDEAINNISTREQQSSGVDIQFTVLRELFDRRNHLVAGIGYYRGDSDFRSATELSELDPLTRSTAGLGTGTFVEDQAVNVETRTRTWSLYFTNTIDVSDALGLTLAGRYNSTDVKLQDRSGDRPELNGDHRFSRFNPSLGLTFRPWESATLFASYSESSRAPTPIELACNEGVFEVARRFALERGDDPEDIDFECRLPNAFLADPPLHQVVAKSFELGLRGYWRGIEYGAGIFHTVNNNDILFQTTGRATGLFANVDKTKRRGFESSLTGRLANLDWSLSYSFIDATFGSDLRVLSPNHPSADDAGEIRVTQGNRIPGIPEHQLKVSGDYRVSGDINLGMELIYNSDQVLRGDESNQLGRVGGYTLVNLRASYSPRDWLNLYVRITNLLDKRYENFGLLGEEPGEIVADLADQRPVFLGVGSPRAGWIGLRATF